MFGLILADDVVTITVSTLMGDVSSIFSSIISMAGTVAETIVGDPLLLLFCLIPIVGIGVGLFKRLLSV